MLSHRKTAGQKGRNNNSKKPHNGSGDAPADEFDEFGILRSIDRNSDSVPIDDPSLNLSDEDTSTQVVETSENELQSPASKEHLHRGTTSDSEPLLDFSTTSGNIGLSDFRSQLEDLTADLTGASEDISKASDGQKKKLKHQASSDSASQHQDETESLTEFEEIERLIQANTAADSDDDLSDIPEDLEQKILSGRKSRESTRSDGRSDGGRSPPNHAPASSTSSSSESSSVDGKKFVSSKGAHHDTGYASEGLKTPEDIPGPSAVTGQNQDMPQLNHEESEESLPPLQSWLIEHEDEPLHSTSRIPSHENLNHLYSANSRQVVSSSDEGENEVNTTGGTDLDVTLDRFMVPTQRADTHQPNSLVATFGTTEEFRDLLIRQLDDMQTDELMDPEDKLAGNEHSGEKQESGQTPPSTGKRKKLPQQPRERGNSPNRTRMSPRTQTSRGLTEVKPQSRSRLKLSSNNKQSPRDITLSSERARTSSRSPAASRVRRKNNQSSGRRSASLHRESSTDDMSIRSDISRTELKSKLKEEALSRKREEEMVRELQSNYDSLLMKFAQAENTIDHLRVGAKINIFASVPRPSPEDPTLPFEEGQLKHQQQSEDNHNIPQQQSQVNPGMHSGNHYHQSSGGSFAPSAGSKRDSLVESSLQLPAAATTEFLKVALQLQAKDLQDKIELFNTLLNETELSGDEMQQAMDSITESLRNLEQDYLNAIDEHTAEQKKRMLATGGSMDQCQQFDPGRSMERDIGRLGDMVNNLRTRVANQKFRSHDPVSARSYVTESEVESSPEGDVDSKFNQLLHKYNRPAPTDDGHTTAPSQYLSSQDEEDFSPRPLSNRYFEPASGQLDTSVASQTPRTPVQSPQTQPRRQRYQSSFSSIADSVPSTSPSPTRRSHTRLPRPVGKSGKERRAPSRDGKKAQQADKGTDSGFVGSESSRQSASATPLQPTRVKLVSRPPTAVETQQTQPKLPEKRERTVSGDTTSTMTTTDRFPNRTVPQPSYIDRVGIYKPPNVHDDSLDDLSTTSTVREALRPRHPSRSCSTSTAPSQATAVRKAPFSGYPHGSKSGASVKSRDSGKRSVASSMRDSTLDAIRGEISRLRGEINAAKANEKENLRPTHTSTPRQNFHGRNSPAVSDNEQLQAIRDDIKALKDEVQRGGTRKPTDIDDLSLKSADLTTGRSRERGRRSRRSRSLGRDDASEASTRRNDTSPEVEGRRRRRSRSQNRNPWQGGYWTYVPPAPLVTPVWGAPPTSGRTYTRAQSPVHIAPVYAPPQVVHTAPVIGPPPSVVYVEPPTPVVGRMYTPSTPRHGRIYTTPSKPKASVYISPKHGSGGSIRKASVYIMESDGEEPLRRSHLRRSSSMSKLHTKPSSLVILPDSRLNDSIERAERSADQLRSHSRQMYRTVRDDLYRTQLLAETM